MIHIKYAEQWFPKCGLLTSNICITWEFVRNTSSQPYYNLPNQKLQGYGAQQSIFYIASQVILM